MFKGLKAWECLGNEKGEMPYGGALPQSVHAVYPHEASHSASTHYTPWKWNQSACLCPELVLPSGPFVLEIAFQTVSSQDLRLPLCYDKFWAEARFQLGPIIFFLTLLCSSCTQLTLQSSFPWWVLVSRRAINDACASCGDRLQESQSPWCQTVSC